METLAGDGYKAFCLLNFPALSPRQRVNLPNPRRLVVRRGFCLLTMILNRATLSPDSCSYVGVLDNYYFSLSSRKNLK
jgi:hypothetical protein